MKNLLDEIKRFRQITGLLLEDDSEVCEKGDCKNGEGILTKSGEWSYTGNFKNGKYDGQGVYTVYKDGNVNYIFTGTFSNDSYSKGKLEHKTKVYVFEGDFKDDKPYKGTLTKDGILLKGTISFDENNKMHFISDDGKINTEEQEYNDVFDYIEKQKQKNQEEKERKAACIDGDCENGKGKYLGPLGEYEGYFVNGQFEGEGTLNTNLSENEQVVENIDLTRNFHDHKFFYDGQFLEGKFQGKGDILFSDGKTRYVGGFSDNKIDGFGKFTFRNGSTYEGFFKTIPKGDNYKSTYSFETSNGMVTNDIVEYNRDNSIEKIDYQKTEDLNYKNIEDLNVRIFVKVYTEDGDFDRQYHLPNNKRIKLKMQNVAEPKYSYEYDGKISEFVLGDFKYGNYDYVLNVEGMAKVKSNLTISLRNKNVLNLYVTEKSKDVYNLNENDGEKIKRFLTSQERQEKKTCEDKITEFYKIYGLFYDRSVNFDAYPPEELKNKKEIVQNCVGKFKNFLHGKVKDYSNWLTNVPPQIIKYNNTDYNLKDFFDIDYNINENKDIYNKINTMSVSKSLRKVIREYQENKTNLITEKNIIKNRFKFIVESTVFNKTLCLKKLNEEKRNLINKGYNQKLIRESFIDIASSLYAGQSDVNVLGDLKNKLGQKIADQVKNKQTEHEMILNAFNEIPDEVIKNSIDKSDISTLTNEIATKALENYKNQFGEGGIGAAFVSSVDTEKFKIEVNKILKPAIEGLTKSIDDKVKKIRDVMAGNGPSDISMSET